MARNQERRKLRDEAVKSAYQKWAAKHYRHDYCIERVAEQFYLSERTISAIVSGEYDRKDLQREE
jgi:AraC-like DNA-binding protein